MRPSFEKNSKSLYLYNEVTKELIYVSTSQTEMGQALGISPSNLGTYRLNNSLYLNRFILSDIPLDPDKYTTNLIGKEELSVYMDEIIIIRRKEVMKQVDSKRAGIISNQSKRVEMTNIKTNEFLTFNSISDTSKYLRSLNPDYKCSPGTVSDAIKYDRLYKGTFKFNLRFAKSSLGFF